MCKHDNIEQYINIDKTGKPYTSLLYGYDSLDDTVSLWSSTKINEDMETNIHSFTNPLVVRNDDFNVVDLHEWTSYVGYAVSNDYDSVIIECGTDKFFSVINPIQSDILTEASTPKPIRKQRKRDKKQNTKAIQKNRGKEVNGIESISPTRAPRKGISINVLLSNTGRLSPARVKRAMDTVRKDAPKITGVTTINDQIYIRVEFSFRYKKGVVSKYATTNHTGYIVISSDKKYCSQLFCSCPDFFFRLYAPYVKASLSTWNVPTKYIKKQEEKSSKYLDNPKHNRRWTRKTNPQGKLFLCKHLYALLAYYVHGGIGEMSDDEIDEVLTDYFDNIDPEESETEFNKVFGKLFVADGDSDNIEYYDNKEQARDIKGKKRTFWKLPVNNKIKPGNIDSIKHNKDVYKDEIDNSDDSQDDES